MKMFENYDFAEWLEEGLQVMSAKDKEIGIETAALVVGLKNANVLTSYFNADAQDKAIFAHNINSDIVLDVVKNNREEIQSEWDDE